MFSLISLMPSIVSMADGRHSSSPVVSVKVSASKISSSGSSPCSSQISSLRRWAISSLRSRVLAMPTSSMVSAISAAPWALASGTTVSSLSRPASRFTEFTIARPGICSRLRFITSGSVESIWIGAGSDERDALGQLAHLLVLVLALGERDAEVEHVRAALHLVGGDLEQAVVVVRQQQLLGLARALRVHALAHDRGRGLLRQRGGAHHRARPSAAPARAAGRPRGRRRGRRSRGCGPAWCRSSRRRCPRRASPRTPAARWPAGRAPRGRSSRPPGPGSGCRRWGCSAPAPGCCSPR